MEAFLTKVAPVILCDKVALSYSLGCSLFRLLVQLLYLLDLIAI